MSCKRHLPLPFQLAGKVGPEANREPVAGRQEPKAVLECCAWKSGSEAPFSVAELDQLLTTARAAEPRPVAKILGDEQFLRRVTLDLTGMTPTAAEVESFSASGDPHKRAAAINRLLGADAFAHHWAHFWRNVMQSKASSTQVIFELHRAAGARGLARRAVEAQSELGRNYARPAHGRRIDLRPRPTRRKGTSASCCATPAAMPKWAGLSTPRASFWASNWDVLNATTIRPISGSRRTISPIGCLFRPVARRQGHGRRQARGLQLCMQHGANTKCPTNTTRAKRP